MTLQLHAPLLLVGAGKMGGALLEGWLERGADPSMVFVQDPSPGPEMSDLCQKFGVTIDGKVDLPSEPGIVMAAVKPQIMDQVLPDLKDVVGDRTVVLSIAAGRTVASFLKHFGNKSAVVRAMPNTPAAVGRGITGVYANDQVSQEQKRLCGELLGAVGEVVWVDEESDIDLVTAVSGSGPAYVFYLTECLADAGVAVGLPEDVANRLARATVCGAGDLMQRSDAPASVLRENVTSPGGTTQAALDELMADPDGLADLMKAAVSAAKKRAAELSS